MARIDSLANFLEDVATKIRNKTGSQSTITPANYDTEIEKIVFKPEKRCTFGSTNAEYETTTLNLKNLDTSYFKQFGQMFKGLRGLTSLDLSSFNTSNADDFNAMFQNCGGLTSLDLSTFDTRNAVRFNSMFQSCTKLETITFGTNFTFSSVIGIQNMFGGCTKLDNDTLNQILYLCTTIGSSYTNTKTLDYLGIKDTFDNYANIPNLSNYQAFLDAGWTIS